jgi:ABC-type transport system substrate-binding protein
MMRNNLKKMRFAQQLTISLLLLASFLAACNPSMPTAQEPSTPTQTKPQASATPQPTPTATPPVINVCTAEDPGSLFPYDGNDTASRRTILRILNDGSFENIMTGNGSGLLTAYPQFGNMISQVSVTVSAGAVIMDAYGEVTVLQKGKLVRPSQCRAMDCLISWDGFSELSMDQTVVKFKLNSDEK